ncbi:hypothetical protein BLNAU_5765 [Blattamonas nauphoetae]|uniref:Uncharacterized protein n=1 Tax=Blattamonas nauphoetae TaxID=2049346 RepID=A0ABQ9Y623_9EUKA|nr:hypothetical protein BLNAU_5765 [Blattamonas nauphoetae]
MLLKSQRIPECASDDRRVSQEASRETEWSRRDERGGGQEGPTLQISLVKDHYHLDEALQDKAVWFLAHLDLSWLSGEIGTKTNTDLVLTANGSRVSAAVLSKLCSFGFLSSPEDKLRLVENDFIPNILAALQPHTLELLSSDKILFDLNRFLMILLNLASPDSLQRLNITATMHKYNHHELIFRKVVSPLSQYLSHLCHNRYFFGTGNLTKPFLNILDKLLLISPFHAPTLEFLLSHQIVMTAASLLSFIESESAKWNFLASIHTSLIEWKKQGAEVTQSGKQVTEALSSEGLEESIESMLQNDTAGNNQSSVVEYASSILIFLGSNVFWSPVSDTLYQFNF